MKEEPLDLLLLGSGWTSTFLLPELHSKRITFAHTNRSGLKHPEYHHATSTPPIRFEVDEETGKPTANSSSVRQLPWARTVLVVFPLRSRAAVHAIVDRYEDVHGMTNWLALGSTGAWPKTGRFTSDSPIDPSNARAAAEDELLDYHDPEGYVRYVGVLNLAGLYGGARLPSNFGRRVGDTKEKLAAKGSLHLVHGRDVARAVVGMLHDLKEGGAKAWGRRWIVTDTHVYDWWHLFTTLDPLPVPEGPEWVRALCAEHGVEALPRKVAQSPGEGPPRYLERALSGDDFWRAVGLQPAAGRCDAQTGHAAASGDEGGRGGDEAGQAARERVVAREKAAALAAEDAEDDEGEAPPPASGRGEEEEEEQELRHFERADEFLALLSRYLRSPSQEDLAKLSSMLEPYQEQAHLLDPFLERMVSPPVEALQLDVRGGEGPRPSGSVVASAADEDKPGTKRAEMLAKLIYTYTRVRGYKMTTHFFPHSVEDLQPTLGWLERSLPQDDRGEARGGGGGGGCCCWELRYVLLLWLSLICMIPFDLQRFDTAAAAAAGGAGTSGSAAAGTGSTATRILAVGRAFLGAPGKERDAAAVLLGKFFQRKDVPVESLGNFLEECNRELWDAEAPPSPFLTTGILHSVCEVVKASDPAKVLQLLPSLLRLVDDGEQEDVAGGTGARTGENPRPAPQRNALVAKYRAKLACRIGVKLLRPRRAPRRGAMMAKVLGDPTRLAPPAATAADASVGAEPVATAKVTHQAADVGADVNDGEDGEEDPPEELDRIIAKLLDSLQDRDTIVRYSAAKGVARLCARLPPTFADQVAGAVVGLFPINVVDLLGEREDLSAVSEHTWQGACMALAELARRGLLRSEDLGEVLEWVGKALLFDVRRGSSSVGANVRDAACYVVWALARAHDAEAVRPHALRLAKRLVAVACLDREVSIRRAASAAFQESVGRLSLFPNGIEVIRTADFYAVSNRSNAYLRCCVRVSDLDAYRKHLVDHLLERTLLHWDSGVRELAAKALARLVERHFDELARSTAESLARLCISRDIATLHGAFLGFAELGRVARRRSGENAEVIRDAAFRGLSSVARPVIKRLGNSLMLQAACIAISTNASARTLGTSSAGDERWLPFVEQSQSRPEDDSHRAAAEAWRAIGGVRDLIADWRRLTPSQRRSNALALGMLDHAAFPSCFEAVTEFLVNLLKPPSSAPQGHAPLDVETRRNAVEGLGSAVAQMLRQRPKDVPARTFRSVVAALLACLEDYTTDQRGDVGSWVRIAAVRSLGGLIDAAAGSWSRIQTVGTAAAALLDQDVLDAVCAGMLKQAVERIDSLRAEAGRLWIDTCIKSRDAPAGFPRPPGWDLASRLFPEGTASDFKKPSWLFPRVVQLLAVEPLRAELLRGIVLTLGSKAEIGHGVVGAALAAYASSLPSDDDVVRLVKELVDASAARFSSNRDFVPTLQTLSALLEAESVAQRLAEGQQGKVQLRRCLGVATRGIDKSRTLPRVQACMKLTVLLARLSPTRAAALGLLPRFLAHALPTVRTSTAELAYTLLSDFDDAPEELDESLLETEWSTISQEEAKRRADELVLLVQRAGHEGGKERDARGGLATAA